MRSLAFSLLVCLTLVTGCKKAAAPEAAKTEASPTPTATPEPTPEPTPTPVVIDRSARVIVLCYHRFDDRPKDSLSISPVDFEAQMKALQEANITVVSMEDFLAWRRGEKNIPASSAVISIDDGYNTGYTKAWPILKQFGYPFTMFIYTDYMKGGPKSGGQSMTWEQLEEMRDAGVDIGSHTTSHSALNARKGKSDEQYRAWLRTELTDSKKMIEDKLGISVKTVAYPYGLHNEVVREIVKESGYEAAFTVYGQHLPYNAESTLLGRYAIESNKPDVFKKAIQFNGSSAGGDAGPAPATVMPASATMMTVPMDGETISDPLPEIKVNLATMGAIDPKSVTMRLSGIGAVPASYDEKTKLLSYKLQQKLRSNDVTVIVSALAAGRKVETRWSFKFDQSAAPAATASPEATAAPAAQ